MYLRHDLLLVQRARHDDHQGHWAGDVLGGQHRQARHRHGLHGGSHGQGAHRGAEDRRGRRHHTPYPAPPSPPYHATHPNHANTPLTMLHSPDRTMPPYQARPSPSAASSSTASSTTCSRWSPAATRRRRRPRRAPRGGRSRPSLPGPGPHRHAAIRFSLACLGRWLFPRWTLSAVRASLFVFRRTVCPSSHALLVRRAQSVTVHSAQIYRFPTTCAHAWHMHMRWTCTLHLCTGRGTGARGSAHARRRARTQHDPCKGKAKRVGRGRGTRTNIRL